MFMNIPYPLDKMSTNTVFDVLGGIFSVAESHLCDLQTFVFSAQNLTFKQIIHYIDPELSRNCTCTNMNIFKKLSQTKK